jgi:hypothetical protein
VSLCVFHLSLPGNGSGNTFPRQRVHATIEKLFNASFSVRPGSCQRRIYGSMYPPIVAMQWLGKHVLTATNTSKNRRIVVGVVSYATRVIRKKGRRLVLARISCYLLISLCCQGLGFCSLLWPQR